MDTKPQSIVKADKEKNTTSNHQFYWLIPIKFTASERQPKEV